MLQRYYAFAIADHEAGNRVRVSRRLVGLNPIGFGDPRSWAREDYSAYSHYLDNITAFTLWLLAHNYELRVFSGEVSVDVHAIEDLKGRLLNELSPASVNEIFMLPSENVKDLLIEMAGFDFVVTSKFHGVVFSHLLAKPVIALSYHNKIDDLMRPVGHSHYCLNLETFDDECLKRALGIAELCLQVHHRIEEAGERQLCGSPTPGPHVTSWSTRGQPSSWRSQRPKLRSGPTLRGRGWGSR